MMIGTILLLCALLALSASGFAIVPATTTRSPPQSATSLHLELPSVDPLVLAAGGLAVVGGLGTVVLTSKIREMDSGAGAGLSNSSSSTSSAAAVGCDISIPYDAAAKLAYTAAGSPGDYGAFKAKYEADAVADVKAKQK